jgi:phospholipid/cholesterol/gamma-HCH transport system substrate-binding protein
VTRLPRRLRLLLGLLLGSVVLSGCDFDVYSLPLPGGTDVGDHPIQVTVQFEDVLDLVPKSTVKVNDVSVGQVKEIELDGYHANVTLELRNDTLLPDNAIAEIRQTSLLGEKFVSLSAPETGASEQTLGDGDVIPLDHTGRNPEVEEVLGALSLILNGGGVAQLKTITQELNKAVTGREDNVRSVLSQIDTFTGSLDTNKAQIVDAIEALNRLAVSAHQQEGNIDEALDELPSALTSIDGQRQDLVKMLQALDQLSDVGVRVIKASKTATIDSLRQLQPVLNQLAASGDDFVNAFNVFLTYPFVDEVVGRDPQVARNLHMGDYTNLSIRLDLDLTQGMPTNPTDILPTQLDPGQLAQNVLACIASGSLSSAACQKVLASAEALTKLKEVCQQPANRNKTVCVVLNTVPGLPAAPGGVPTSLPTVLPSLPVLGGLGRSATGPWNDAAHGGPTMAQLQTVYDPSLVNLLVPQLVTGEAP